MDYDAFYGPFFYTGPLIQMLKNNMGRQNRTSECTREKDEKESMITVQVKHQINMADNNKNWKQ